MQNYTYDEIFQRNIGIFTKEEQEKIKNLKIAVIGVGGLGGPVAESLARLGVGELRLVEPDTFEVSNLNRQTGAYLDTLGRNKAEVLAEMARRINPEIKLTVKTVKLHGEELKQLITGCDIIVDGIDYFNIDDTLELHRFAKELKIPLVASQAVFNIVSYSYFNPEGKMLCDLITSDDYVQKVIQATGLFFPALPEEINEEMINGMISSYLSGQTVFALPSYSGNVALTGSIEVRVIVNLLIKTQFKSSIPMMPDLFYFDSNQLKLEHFSR